VAAAYVAWQNVIWLTFVVVWVGVGLILQIRTFTLLFAYLRRFPPVDGIPLDRFVSPLDSWKLVRAQWRVTLQPQRDLELEWMRREVRRRQGVFLVWLFAFLLLFACANVVLVVAIRMQAATQ
jgi:hypothetical protein